MRSLIYATLLTASSLSMQTYATETSMSKYSYSIVHTDELKEWYDEGVEMVVLDVRNQKYYSGIMLPDALWVPYNGPEESIEASIPSKDTLIVLYCWGPNCPMSDWMAERLIAAGYTCMYKYRDGLEDWLEHGYPTTHQ
jgi:rhodanese-related sulfurtransferase